MLCIIQKDMEFPVSIAICEDYGVVYGHHNFNTSEKFKATDLNSVNVATSWHSEHLKNEVIIFNSKSQLHRHYTSDLSITLHLILVNKSACY